MAHLSVKHFSPLRKSFSPSLRHCLHFASRFLAMRSPGLSCYTRRRLGARQPLCGTGVTSAIEPIFRPIAFSARTADSRPGPGPLMRTSMFFTPHSCAARPARSAAICAANGVDLREPLKPALPDVAQDSVLPWRSVMVTMVLLKDACTWAMPSATFFFTFLRARAEAVCCSCCDDGAVLVAMGAGPVSSSWSELAGRRVHLDRGLARAFARARVGARALPAHRQPLAMARAAVAAEV